MKEYLKNKTMQESTVFFIMGAGLLIYGLVNHYSVDISWGMSPYLFPVLIAVFLIILSTALFLEGKKNMVSEDAKLKRSLPGKRVFAVIALSLIYYAAIPFIGFVISTILFLTAFFIFLGERRWPVILAVSMGVALSVYLVFGKILGVMLP